MTEDVLLFDGSTLTTEVDYRFTQRTQITEGVHRPDGIYIEEGTVVQFYYSKQRDLMVRAVGTNFKYKIVDDRLIAEFLNTHIIERV